MLFQQARKAWKIAAPERGEWLAKLKDNLIDFKDYASMGLLSSNPINSLKDCGKPSSKGKKMLDFTRGEVEGQNWTVVSDAVHGGHTQAELAHHEDKEDDGLAEALLEDGKENEVMLRSAMPGQVDLYEKDRAVAKLGIGTGGGFMRFSGDMSLKLGPKMVQSGFAAAMLHVGDYKYTELGELEVLQMRVRSDGRRYNINIHPDTMITDDVYQGYLILPPGKWVTVSVPFNKLLLTSRGYPKLVQRRLERIGIKDLGFALDDGKDGPFQLDVKWVAAMPGPDPDNNQNKEEWPLVEKRRTRGELRYPEMHKVLLERRSAQRETLLKLQASEGGGEIPATSDVGGMLEESMLDQQLQDDLDDSGAPSPSQLAEALRPKNTAVHPIR